MNYNDQVTMLGNLPHLEDMNGHAPSDESIRKSLRHNHQPLAQSGMTHTDSGAPYSPLPSSSSYRNDPSLDPPRGAFYSPAYHPMEIETYSNSSSSPTCLDIHGHVKDCPICTRFYGSSERLFYIIFIIILVVVCLLLLRKVLDKNF